MAAWFFLAPAPSWAAAPACEPAPQGRAVAVRHVHDGDTVVLKNGQRLRLMGIDTPELARDGKPAEPLAIQARQRLQQLLGHRPQLRLLKDRTVTDHYGRQLAHAYLPDGRSVQQTLLAEGLAVLFLVPPNSRNTACYTAAEAEARKARRGLWALPQYQPVEARLLPADAKGYRRVRGRVVRVSESRYGIWLDLEAGVALRVDRGSLAAFGPQDWRDWRGQRVEARGKLHRHGHGWHMTIFHPHALQRLDG